MTILGQETITRRRFAAGSYDSDGRYVDGASTDAPISAGVQPATGKDLEVLEPGLRSRDAKKIYTETELRVADPRDNVPADQLVIDGDVYQVEKVKHHRSVMIHFHAIAVRLRESA